MDDFINSLKFCFQFAPQCELYYLTFKQNGWFMNFNFVGIWSMESFVNV